MDEKRLAEIEKNLNADQEHDGKWEHILTDSLRILPIHVRELIAEVRRLREHVAYLTGEQCEQARALGIVPYAELVRRQRAK